MQVPASSSSRPSPSMEQVPGVSGVVVHPEARAGAALERDAVADGAVAGQGEVDGLGDRLGRRRGGHLDGGAHIGGRGVRARHPPGRRSRCRCPRPRAAGRRHRWSRCRGSPSGSAPGGPSWRCPRARRGRRRCRRRAGRSRWSGRPARAAAGRPPRWRRSHRLPARTPRHPPGRRSRCRCRRPRAAGRRHRWSRCRGSRRGSAPGGPSWRCPRAPRGRRRCRRRAGRSRWSGRPARAAAGRPPRWRRSHRLPARTLSSPAWEAVTVQVPASSSSRPSPSMEQVPGVSER